MALAWSKLWAAPWGSGYNGDLLWGLPLSLFVIIETQWVLWYYCLFFTHSDLCVSLQMCTVVRSCCELRCSLQVSSCKFCLLKRLYWGISISCCFVRCEPSHVYCLNSWEPCRRHATPELNSTWQTWLILPVVICLSQRLSHACLSISFYTAKLRMAH